MRKWLMVTDSYKSGYYPWPPKNIVEPDKKFLEENFVDQKSVAKVARKKVS
jgi:hypothetical protein